MPDLTQDLILQYHNDVQTELEQLADIGDKNLQVLANSYREFRHTLEETHNLLLHNKINYDKDLLSIAVGLTSSLKEFNISKNKVLALQKDITTLQGKLGELHQEQETIERAIKSLNSSTQNLTDAQALEHSNRISTHQKKLDAIALKKANIENEIKVTEEQRKTLIDLHVNAVNTAFNKANDAFKQINSKIPAPPAQVPPVPAPNANPVNPPPDLVSVAGGNSPKQIPNKQGRTFIIEKTVLEERTLGTNFYYSTGVVKASDVLNIGSFSSFKETGDVEVYNDNPNNEIAYEGKVISKGEIIPCLFAPPGSKPVLEEKTQQNAAAYDNAAENRYGLLKVDHTGKISSTSKNLSEAEKEELAFHQAKMLLDNYQPSKDGKTIFINGRNPEMVKKVYAALLFFKKNVPEFEDIKIQSLVLNTKPSTLPFKSALNMLMINHFISKNLKASDNIKDRYQEKMENIAHIKNTLATKMDKIRKEYNKLDEENVKLSKELSKKPNVLFKQTRKEKEKKEEKIEENFKRMETIEAEFHRHNSLKGKLIKLKEGEVTISDDNGVKNENNIKP